MFEKLKQFKDLRDQAKTLQGLLAQETVHNERAGGKLAMVMDGNQKVLSLSVDPEYLNPERQAELERELAELVNGTISKVQRVAAQRMQASGFKLPGLN